MEYNVVGQHVIFHITHGTKTLKWSAKRVYKKNNFSPKNTEERPLDILNIVLGKLTDDQASNVLGKLTEIKDFFHVQLGPISHSNNLFIKNKLEEIINMPGLRHFEVRNIIKDIVTPPPGINKTFIKSDNPTFTAEGTYTAEQYMDLVLVLLYCKLFAPVFGYYIFSLRTTAIRSAEMECLSILPPSLTSLPGFMRLYTYTSVQVDKFGDNYELLLKNDIDSGMKLDWIFGFILCNKLVFSNILYDTDDTHLIKSIHGFIKSKCNNESSGKYKDKKISGSVISPDDEVNGVYDSYRSKDTLSVNTKVSLSYCGNKEYILGLLGNRVNHKEVSQISSYLSSNMMVISDIHIHICKWVMSPLLPTDAFYLLDISKIYDIMAITHLLLREKHEFMSLLVISNKILEDSGEPERSMNLHRSRLVQDDIDRIRKEFPTYRAGKTKRFHIIELIEAISKDILYCWNINLQELYDSAYIDRINIRLLVPDNTKKLLLELMLDLYNLTEIKNKNDEIKEFN